jgi:hypothetical protein
LLLNPARFKRYVDAFNDEDDELYAQTIANRQAWEFLEASAPLLECPDAGFERNFIFRW